jgi:hypothetical protein
MEKAKFEFLGALSMLFLAFAAQNVSATETVDGKTLVPVVKGVGEVNELLKPFGAPFTVPSVKEFVAKKKFVFNASENARVRIRWLGDRFKQVMLPKTEHDVAKTELRFSKLETATLDSLIITELGDRAEITLHHFYETLAHKKQVRDYEWIIGYVRGVDGYLWAVGASWDGGGWDVRADSVDSPGRWGAGVAFVSR